MSAPPPDNLFAAPRREAGLPITAIAIAGTVVAVVLAALLLLGHHGKAAPAGEQPAAPYAANLVFSPLTMSESESLAGGKQTYIDGSVTNRGTQTVRDATLQVFFRNDMALPPQIETVPLRPIRTREPYIDTVPLSAAPLKPGETREFRLTFENIGANWNQATPELRVVQTTLQ